MFTCVLYCILHLPQFTYPKIQFLYSKYPQILWIFSNYSLRCLSPNRDSFKLLVKINHDLDLLISSHVCALLHVSSHLPGLEFCRFRSRGFYWGGHYRRLHRLLLRLLWTWYPKCSQRIDPIPGTSEEKKRHSLRTTANDSCCAGVPWTPEDIFNTRVLLTTYVYNVRTIPYFRLCTYSTAIHQQFPISHQLFQWRVSKRAVNEYSKFE